MAGPGVNTRSLGMIVKTKVIDVPMLEFGGLADHIEDTRKESEAAINQNGDLGLQGVLGIRAGLAGANVEKQTSPILAMTYVETEEAPFLFVVVGGEVFTERIDTDSVHRMWGEPLARKHLTAPELANFVVEPVLTAVVSGVDVTVGWGLPDPYIYGVELFRDQTSAGVVAAPAVEYVDAGLATGTYAYAARYVMLNGAIGPECGDKEAVVS
jgi:hypothetical protein